MTWLLKSESVPVVNFIPIELLHFQSKVDHLLPINAEFLFYTQQNKIFKASIKGMDCNIIDTYLEKENIEYLFKYKINTCGTCINDSFNTCSKRTAVTGNIWNGNTYPWTASDGTRIKCSYTVCIGIFFKKIKSVSRETGGI